MPFHTKPDETAISDPIKIYVGTDRSQSLALNVLEYSIRRHTNRAVELRSLEGIELPEPRDIRQGQRTGFSFARWAIPELTGYSGKAIYLDADMQVFRDIAELWDVPMNGAKIAVLEADREAGDNVHYNKNETSVMVLDCARCDWKLKDLVKGLDEGAYDYRGLMMDLRFLEEPEIARTIPAEWNRLQHFTPATGLLHYTMMPIQPWVSARNPLGHIWINEVRRMIEDGSLTREAVQREVDLGYFRPSLMVEIDEGPNEDQDKERIEALEALDRSTGYIPHRSVQEFDRKRRDAIHAYERRNAREQGLAPYAAFLARDAASTGLDLARRVKRRLTAS